MRVSSKKREWDHDTKAAEDIKKKRDQSIGYDEVLMKVPFYKHCKNCSLLLSKGLSSALCRQPHY
jgi:hypothetical protein